MKKIFALVMVATIIGGILAGCKSEESTPPANTPAPAAGSEAPK